MPAEAIPLFDHLPLAEVAASACAAPSDPDCPPKPRFKNVDRHQIFFTVVDVEKLVEENHPARAIWEFVQGLDLSAFIRRARAVEGKAGRPRHDPALLISIWIYAYSQGIASAREIASLLQYQPALRWLAGASDINHHSLSSFRVEHAEALEDLFAKVVAVLMSQGLVKLNRIMLDGTKIEACAAADGFRREQTVDEHLAAARAHLAEILTADERELSLQQRAARERAARERVQRLKAAKAEFGKLDKKAEGKEARVSTSDPEARVMKQPNGGFAPSYNAQVSTDDASGAVVSVALTQAGNDCEQLLPALDRIKAGYGKLPPEFVADGGYVSRGNIVGAAEREVEFYGPVRSREELARNGSKTWKIDPEFHADKFRYDEQGNCMHCPAGRRLRYDGKTETPFATINKYVAEAGDCKTCAHKTDCCPKTNKCGRSVTRSLRHKELVAYETRMSNAEAQQIYRRRAQVAETPHLWWKAKFGLRQFHVRGLAKAGLELLWVAVTYNVKLLLRANGKVALAGV
jgi:transposase